MTSRLDWMTHFQGNTQQQSIANLNVISSSSKVEIDVTQVWGGAGDNGTVWYFSTSHLPPTQPHTPHITYKDTFSGWRLEEEHVAIKPER